MIRLFLLSWIAGISLIGSTVETLTHLHKFNWHYLSLVALVICLLLWYRQKFEQISVYKILIVSLSCMAIFATAWQYADRQLNHYLASEVKQRQTVEGMVYISKLSEGKLENWRQKAELLIPSQQQTLQILLYPKRIYDVEGAVIGWSTDQFQLGKYYQVTLDIKPPHSYVNSGGFDQEKWLLQEGLQGTASVLFSKEIQEDEIIAQGWYGFVLQQQTTLAKWQIYIEILRQQYRTHLLQSNHQSHALLLGLLTGDRSGIHKDTIELYQYMGMSHLLAISGPHVLILATLITWLFMKIIHLLMYSGYLPRLYLYVPKQRLYLPLFVAIVSFYVAFTGFEIPALRTWIITIICSISLWMQWKISPFTLLLFAASVVLYINSFSILSAAFWLSFTASGVLLLIYQQIQKQPLKADDSFAERLKKITALLWQSQWRIFITLMPIVLWQFKAISLIAPFINLVAIPFLGGVIVPLDIVAALLWQLFPILGDALWWISSTFLSLFNACLKLLIPIAKGLYLPSYFSFIELCSISLAILVFSLPRGLIHPVWGVFFVLPLFLPIKNALLQLDILDVGQGQAILLTTTEHRMLIDAGGGSGHAGQMTMGDRVIVPFLRSQGIKGLDEILLTHLDLDHRGGAQAVIDNMKVKQIRSNQYDAEKLPISQVPFIQCNQGQDWQWDGVKIEVLWPMASDSRKNANESSCVVLVHAPMENEELKILMMGDAGWETEYHLLQYYPDLQADILILGHHGSKYSSAYDFLKQINPKAAISSSGIDNRYGHPTPEMMARLNDLQIPHLNTVTSGRISITLKEKHSFWKLSQQRQRRKWHLPY